MTGLPSEFDVLRNDGGVVLVMSRPGANGTTQVIGREGNSFATAAAINAMVASATAGKR